MFRLANARDRGKYLEYLIRKKYKSVRKFGAACLREEGVEVNDENLRRQANRLSQMIHGNKSIQIADLPIFSKLLETSCEELLGATKCGASTDGHLSNYTVAASTDPAVWEKYTTLEQNPILNADEYGKTVIDYAFEFENYEFFKYMVQKGYIYFVNENPDYRGLPWFGAGTSIEKSEWLMHNYDQIRSSLVENGQLRRDLILMAIRRKDLTMLEAMHAREIPAMYCLGVWETKASKFAPYYDQALINALAEADEEVIAYFSQEITIRELSDSNKKLIYPFLGELAAELIERGRKSAVPVLKAAVAHNQAAYQALKRGVERRRAQLQEKYDACCNDGARRVVQSQMDEICENVEFYNDGKVVTYHDWESKDTVIVNVTRGETKTSDPEIWRLIQNLNASYNQLIVLQRTGR